MIDINGVRHNVVPHLDLTWLTAQGHVWSKPERWYVGPGITWDAASKRVYIRLDNSSPEAQAHRSCVTQLANPDPNRYPIRIAPRGKVALKISGSHLSFEGIHFRGHDTAWVVAGSPTDLRFVDCVAEPQTRVARLANATDVKILGGTFTGHMHSATWWASVGDIHGGPAAGAEKSAFDLGATTNVELGPSPTTGRRMTVRGFFDGILAIGPLKSIHVHGVWFDEIWDDAWQMRKNVADVDYHDNVHFGAGPSRSGSPESAEPGAVYIHDNVIDTTIHPLFWWRGGRASESAVGESIVFSSHNQPSAEHFAWPWKLYHNTVYTGTIDQNKRYVGVGYFGLNTSKGQPHEVFNNILVVLNGRPLATHFWAASGRERYDGNCLWSARQWERPEHFGPYQRVHTATDPNGSTVKSVEDLHAKVPSWEAAGITRNPRLSMSYKPTDPDVRTGAVDLSARRWPGASPARQQRGAKLTAPLPIGAGEVPVPYVIGERFAIATECLRAAGLIPVAPLIFPVLVSDQDPLPGTVVPARTEVTLT
ncbi:MAG: PASTA domain-containing protein, partial [Actinobacteria bacterium]|nr:PASTA domain-containing protein [Actinomycetota bacterium]